MQFRLQVATPPESVSATSTMSLVFQATASLTTGEPELWQAMLAELAAAARKGGLDVSVAFGGLDTGAAVETPSRYSE